MRIAAVLVMVALLVGCAGDPGMSSKLEDGWVKDWVPKRAAGVENLGNGWYYFHLDGNRYLLKTQPYGYVFALAPEVTP